MYENWALIDVLFRRLLLEEALSCAETKTIELVTPSECVCEGVEPVRVSCGIALGEEAFPMLESFRSINPDSPTGTVVWISSS